ncbi:MAG: replication initiation protein [Bacteroidota bacterium]
MSALKDADKQIIQQNKILTGGQTISLRARQLIYTMASLIDKDNPYKEVYLDGKEFMNYINRGLRKRRWSDVYSTVNEIFTELNNNPILIRKPKSKDFEKINWVSSLGVSQGQIKCRFSTDIGEYLVYRKGLPYTKLIWDLRSYKSSYTARILDLFQRYHIKEHGQTEVEFEYNFDELKLFFGVHEKYPRANDFKKRVLEAAKTELDESDFAPYYFEYDVLKRGRSVDRVKFHVFVRSKRLMALLPGVHFRSGGDHSQGSLFGKDIELSEKQQYILEQLTDKMGVPKELATTVIYKLTESQSWGYYYLIRYGVNRSLAFTIIEEYCSFGEIVGYEGAYVKHSLSLLENARLSRIEEAKKKKNSKLRTTPEGKRGGLAKKVFLEKQHFASFMEILSANREDKSRNRTGSKKGSGDGTHSLDDILKDAF